MKTKLTKKGIPFTQVPNEVFNDKNISWKAKGLYGYLQSKPDNWNFSAKRIAEDSCNSHEIVLNTLKELENNGYLERVKKNDGKMDYYLKYGENPSWKKPKLELYLP